jgi:hypothetical protein
MAVNYRGKSFITLAPDAQGTLSSLLNVVIMQIKMAKLSICAK